MALTPTEQFDTLNTPEWLTAFRTQCDEVITSLTNLRTTVTSFSFEVDGVPCCVEIKEDSRALAHIGRDGVSWLFDIVAPSGWFRPPSP